MTKNLFLKLNMAIVFVVVLFAGVTFADVKDIVGYLSDNKEEIFSTGMAATEYTYNKDGNTHQTALVKLNAKLLSDIKGMGGRVFYSQDDDGNTSLYIQDENGNIAKFTSANVNGTNDFQQVNMNSDVKEIQGGEKIKNIKSANDLLITSGADIVELTSDSVISDLSKTNELFVFGIREETSSTASSISFVDQDGEKIIGNTSPQIIDKENVSTTFKVDIWNEMGGTVIINANNLKYVEEINNKTVWKYHFKASEQGTYRVTININETNEDYDSSIQFIDLGTGEHKYVSGGAYEKDMAGTNQNNIVLNATDEYFWSFNANSKVTITYEFLHTGLQNPNDYDNMPSSSFKRKSLFETIEEIFSDFVLSIARVLNWIVAMSMGENVTIDRIVFNEYPDAKLEFFKTDIYGSDVDTKSSIIASLRDPITSMYGLFRNLAIVGYLVILVYIGIKIMLSSTTAQKKAGYKETFLAWVGGIIILFFMPYYMKYTIALNDAFVKFVREIPSVDKIESQVKYANVDTQKGFVYTNFENAIDVGEGDNKANDYMSTVYSLANKEGRLGYSIAYLVMSWQVIMLVVYYYKRAFIVALLIIIFPLIAFSYVWDKLNDGKSQALSSWIKEFTISVIVQAFHAIVFSFVVCTIYASILRSTDERGLANPDFILLIIASKFLFEGEQILKQVFGGGGDVLGTAAQTGVRIAAVTRLTTGVIGRTVNNVVGTTGDIRKGWRAFQAIRRDNNLLKERPELGGKSAFDILSTTPAKQRRISELLPSEGDVSTNINKAAEMIDRLNNMKNNTDKQNAETVKMYKELLDARHGKGPNAMTPEEAKQFDAMMKKCNLNKDQLDKINNAATTATAAYFALGDNPTKEQVKHITQRLRLEIEAVLPQTDANGNKLSGKMNVRANLMTEAVLRNIGEGLYTERNQNAIEQSYDEAIKDMKLLSDRMHFAKEDDIEKLATSKTSRRKRANQIFEGYKKDNQGMTRLEARKARAMSRDVAMMEQAISKDKNEVVTSAQAVRAMGNIQNNSELASAMMKHSDIRGNISMLSGALSLKLVNSDTSIKTGPTKPEEAMINRTQTIVDQYIEANKETFDAMDEKAKEDRLKEIRRVATEFAYLEFVDTGIKSDSITKDVLKEKLNELENETDKELVRKIRELYEFEYDNAELRSELNRMTNDNWGEEAVKDWSQSTIEQLENEAHNRAESFDNGSITYDDPYSTILDIIEAAQRSSNKIHIGSLDDLFANASKPEVRETIINRKKRMSIAEQLKVKEFGEVGLRIEDYEYRRAGDFTSSDNGRISNDMQRTRNLASNIRRAVEKNMIEEKRETEQPTFEGYTKDEIKKRREDNVWTLIDSTVGTMSDVVLTPFTTLAGAAIGAAITDDGMPIEEAFTGAMGGFKAGTSVSDKVISKVTMEDSREKERAEIQKKIKKRIRDEQKERYKAREATEDSDENSRRLDNTLVLAGATAHLHIGTDRTLSATVNIRASNAEYMSIDETPIIPSSGWVSYEDTYTYTFKDPNPKADHNLYIYVRDKDGNVKGARIEGIHL